jgi:hypothetical protein
MTLFCVRHNRKFERERDQKTAQQFGDHHVMGLPMTIRGGGDPMYSVHGFHAAVKNGPASPELAADAYDCIMVRSQRDRPNIRLWRAISARPDLAARLGYCPVHCDRSHVTSNEVCSAMWQPYFRPKPPQCAVVLAAVKDARAASRWPEYGPSLTAAARDGARNERPGRENGSAGAEQENWRSKMEVNENRC